MLSLLPGLLAAGLAICGMGFYALCLWSAARFKRENHDPQPGATPPVTILKPLRGVDPQMYESFRSHCLQDYPEYEIIFGVSEADDPAVASVRQLQQEFSGRRIELVVCPQKLGANIKVSNLVQMLQVARYERLLVNDSDIRVEAAYLRHVVAPLADQHIGMVTCLYRGVAAPTLGSKLESL